MNYTRILLHRLSPYCTEALDAAILLCEDNLQSVITPEHFLLKLLEKGNGDIHVFMHYLKFPVDSLCLSLNLWVDQQPCTIGDCLTLSTRLEFWFRKAWLYASLDDESEVIRSQHLLMALLRHSELADCSDLESLQSLRPQQLISLKFILETQSEESLDLQNTNEWRS